MSRLARPPAGGVQQQMRNRAIASSASPCRRWIHVLRSDFGGGGAQSRLSFGAAVESWRVRSLCVQIRLICPHARPGALQVRARGWHWHRQLHWIPGTMSAMSTTMRTLACALP